MSVQLLDKTRKINKLYIQLSLEETDERTVIR